jgi:hypothetical protein
MPNGAAAGNLFHTEAQTRDWSKADIAVRCRRTSTAPSRVTISKRRDAVGRAVSLGDVDAIIVAYLELARALIDDHQLATATTELEEAVALLSCETEARSVPVWRLLLSLAALYDGLGDRARAGRAALAGCEDARRASDAVGQDRARSLIERIAHGRSRAPSFGSRLT